MFCGVEIGTYSTQFVVFDCMMSGGQGCRCLMGRSFRTCSCALCLFVSCLPGRSMAAEAAGWSTRLWAAILACISLCTSNMTSSFYYYLPHLITLCGTCGSRGSTPVTLGRGVSPGSRLPLHATCRPSRPSRLTRLHCICISCKLLTGWLFVPPQTDWTRNNPPALDTDRQTDGRSPPITDCVPLFHQGAHSLCQVIWETATPTANHLSAPTNQGSLDPSRLMCVARHHHPLLDPSRAQPAGRHLLPRRDIVT